MHWNASTILAATAFGFAVAGIVKPAWPLVAVAAMLIAIAVFLIAGRVP